MNPVAPAGTQLNPEDIRATIVTELQIDHLSEDEQNQIVEALGEVLLERATYEVMRNIPESEYETLDKLTEEGRDEDMQAIIRKYVPNVEAVVAQAVQDGIAEHKRLVMEEVESRMSAEPVATPTE
jgi:ATP phosphoribosyltransferase